MTPRGVPRQVTGVSPFGGGLRRRHGDPYDGRSPAPAGHRPAPLVARIARHRNDRALRPSGRVLAGLLVHERTLGTDRRADRLVRIAGRAADALTIAERPPIQRRARRALPRGRRGVAHSKEGPPAWLRAGRVRAGGVPPALRRVLLVEVRPDDGMTP